MSRKAQRSLKRLVRRRKKWRNSLNFKIFSRPVRRMSLNDLSPKHTYSLEINNNKNV